MIGFSPRFALRFAPRFALVGMSFLLAAACSPRPRAVSPPSAPPAHAVSAKTLNADEAVRALIEADTFEDVAVSIDGHLSDGVRAFRAVFAAPDAADRFREIRARGTLVGQLYATIGLRHHDPAAYAEAVQALRVGANERVAVRYGCIGFSERVGELLESRETTAIRLARGQTFEQWLAIHKTGHTDIVGGAFTSQFGQVPSRL